MALFPLLWAEEQGDPAAKSLTRRVETTASLPNPAEEQLRRQALLAAQPAIRLYVKNEGWYRITFQELIAAGLDARADPRKLQLYVDGREQPILISGSRRGHLDSTGSVGFYGMGIDSPVTSTRVYWLVAGGDKGRRIPKVRAKISAKVPSGFLRTVERRERTIHFSSLRDGDRENFFGPVVAGELLEQPLFLQHIDRQAPDEGAFLVVTLQGANPASHRIRVDFNAQKLGEIVFDGQALAEGRFGVLPSLLKEGENRVTLTPLGGETDVSLTDCVRLTYPHTFEAEEDLLQFTALGQRPVQIDGFHQRDIRVFDVSFPEKIVELKGKVGRMKGDFSVTVSSPENGPRLLLAFSGRAVTEPLKMQLNRPSQLRRRQPGADLLIITPREFFATFEPLQTARQKQGLQVALVDVEDIIDEFSFGHRTPQAIKDFLQYAGNQWETKPRFVLLAGDASLDPKGYQRSESADMVPTKLLDTLYMETCSDDWLADFNNTGLASLAIGRLPFNNSAEASRMINKILKYESMTPRQEILLVSDDNFSSYNFAEATAKLQPLIPNFIQVQQLNRGQIEAPVAKRFLNEAFNRGQTIVNYMGHGSVAIWRGDLLTAAEAKALSNGDPLPIFVMMTCLNGYFIDPALDCLAEALLKAEVGGAVAVWTSSGQTEPGGQLLLNQEFLRLFFDAISAKEQNLTLGEAALRAKSAVNVLDIRRTWILFGDPSMPLWR